jgi:glycosyltransferase involved in cell wall biosynthesis
VLPNFTPKPVLNKTKNECREYFGYSPDDWVITCAAAWNRHHKRIDYLIEEVAKINDERVKLLLCGHPELDTDYLKALAQRLMPGRVQWHTLPAHLVSTALTAADVFVLPSLSELFGGVLIETIMLGIPVIAHHTAAGQQLTGLQFKTYDLSQPDNLTNYLIPLRKSPPPKDALLQLAYDIGQSFSQERLSQQFVEMIETVATSAEKSQKPTKQE